MVSREWLVVLSFQLVADRKGILAKRSKGKKRLRGALLFKDSLSSLFSFILLALYFLAKRLKGKGE